MCQTDIHDDNDNDDDDIIINILLLYINNHVKCLQHLLHLCYIDSKVSKMLCKIWILYHVVFIVGKYILTNKYI